jgi:DNA-binding NarL/FixJ family response regulator
MSAKIDISVSGLHNISSQRPMEFFADTQWNQLTEIHITKSIQEIFALARPLSESFYINLVIYSDDPERLNLLIKRNILRHTQMHQQRLSAREIEIFNLIVQGYTNKEIADKVFLSFETIRSHRKHILQKTGCANTVMLINYFHNVFLDDQ